MATSIVTAQDTGAFGIRPATQQNIPDTILRVRLATLDVSSLRSTLVSAAATNGPFRIQLGNFDFAMRVQPGTALEFDPNATLPAAFNGLLMFEGVLTTCVGGSADGSPCEDDSECPGGACEADPNSLVTFTVGPDDPNAKTRGKINCNYD